MILIILAATGTRGFSSHHYCIKKETSLARLFLAEDMGLLWRILFDFRFALSH